MKNKNDKMGAIVILVLSIIISILIIQLFDYIPKHKRIYEYAINGEFRESDNCYVKDDDPYCNYKGKDIMVDYYYYDED